MKDYVNISFLSFPFHVKGGAKWQYDPTFTSQRWGHGPGGPPLRPPVHQRFQQKAITSVHIGIIWPHGWPKVIFQSWNIIMILLTAIEKCCGYSKPLRLFHSYVWFICDNRSKLKKSGILSGGPLSTKKPWLHLVEHCGLTSWARGLSLVAAESAWNGLHVHITKTIFLIY